MTSVADQAAVEDPIDIDGIALIQRLLNAAKLKDVTRVAVAWDDIQDPDAMAALADCWRFDTEKLSGLLSVLEAIPGQVGKTRSLRNAIKRLADERSRREASDKLDDLVSQLGQPISLATALDAAAPPPSVVDFTTLNNLRVPVGYSVDPSGVFKVAPAMDGSLSRSRITAAPIFIVSRTEDVHTGEARRQVVWRGPSGWCSRTLDRRTILDASRIVALASLEAPVSSNHAATLVGYLADFEAENQHRFASVRSSVRMGWLPDGGFLLPDGHYAPDGSKDSPFALTPPAGFERMAHGWKPGGEWATWLTAAELITESPLMMIALYASAAAPLLTILNQTGFVVDFSGETSGGKTTALRMSASVWGKPSESYPTAMYSWDATKVWIERTAGFLHNLPLILDETKRAKHPNVIRDVIYDFCQGQGRGRGNPDGTRAIDTWRSVLVSSGEGAATSFSEDAGTRARVLTLKGKPLGNDPRHGGAISEDLQGILKDNYGHLGRRIVLYLVGNKKHHDAIRAVFADARDRYATASTTADARRHAAHLAVLEVAAAIVHQLGVPRPTCDPMAHLFSTMTSAGLDADRPLAALQDVVSWCATNRIRFWGRHDTLANGNAMIPHQGWAGAWGPGDDWEFIALTSMELRRLLESLGHHPAEVIERWDERGWIKRPDGRNRTRPIRIGGVQARCYCLAKAAVEIALND